MSDKYKSIMDNLEFHHFKTPEEKFKFLSENTKSIIYDDLYPGSKEVEINAKTKLNIVYSWKPETEIIKTLVLNVEIEACKIDFNIQLVKADHDNDTCHAESPDKVMKKGIWYYFDGEQFYDSSPDSDMDDLSGLIATIANSKLHELNNE